ncbi:MAG: divalent-cation tolerance protein CutA [Planctomycetota bacterium]|nr:divalent-cation tolerance protein CutA [Planctomycetota bacterium]
MSDDASPLVPAPDLRMLLCTAPAGRARDLAVELVEARLAACVQLLPGIRSVYRWKGALHDEPETLLLVKTTAALAGAAAAALAERHPYEVPEVLALTPESALPGYLAWLADQVGP